jgi:3-oxoacyl-[acyl-carrier protein] reductase
MSQSYLQGRVAIVTGGSSGIGRAICVALARAGMYVVVVGRDCTRVSQTVAEINEGNTTTETLGLVLDVGSEENMEEMRRQTLARFGKIDVLVASAGIWRDPQKAKKLPSPVVTLPVDEWDEVLRTNLRGVFLSNRAVLPSMIAQHRGTIINISSSPGGLYGNPYASAYCASKFGVIGLSQSLAEEVSDYGVKVYVMLPDRVDTPMLGLLGKARLGESLPPGRVAEFIRYLLMLPDDTILCHPLIAPMMNPDRPLGVNEVVLHPRWIAG